MPMSISEKRSQYPLHERMVVYGPESMERLLTKSENIPDIPENNSFIVNGINILNRNSLDCDTMMNRIIQRRKTHNRVERRRRDKIVKKKKHFSLKKKLYTIDTNIKSSFSTD
jgi:hypothetical protein